MPLELRSTHRLTEIEREDGDEAVAVLGEERIDPERVAAERLSTYQERSAFIQTPAGGIREGDPVGSIRRRAGRGPGRAAALVEGDRRHGDDRDRCGEGKP